MGSETAERALVYVGKRRNHEIFESENEWFGDLLMEWILVIRCQWSKHSLSADTYFDNPVAQLTRGHPENGKYHEKIVPNKSIYRPFEEG